MAKVNARRADTAGVANRFLRQARQASGDDPLVLAEIKKIQDQIDEVRSRAP